MQTLKQHADNTVKTEMKKEIAKTGYILERNFMHYIMGKFGFSEMTVLCSMRRVYPELSLYRRRLSNDLKNYYDICVKNYPTVYLPRE